MTEQSKTGDASAPAAAITEEDLIKSLRELEGKKDEPAAATAPTEVTTSTLTKTAKEVVAEQGSEELKKAINVSSVLGEAVSLMGLHVDQSLKVLEKSIKAGGERDLSFASILTSMNKTIETLAEKVEAFGKEPTASATQRPVTAKTGEVLAKSADGDKPELKPEAVRAQVLAGLLNLQKTAPMGSQEQAGYVNATVKFESTGSIDDLTLAKAMKAA